MHFLNEIIYGHPIVSLLQMAFMLGMAVDAYRRRDLSPVEVVETCLARIEALDAGINAFCHLDPESSRRSPSREAPMQNLP